MDFLRVKEEIKTLKKKQKMDVKAAIRLFKRHNPETKEDVLRMGFKLKKLGSGLYRHGYKLNGFPLVVKFPKVDHDHVDYPSCVDHSSEEIRKLRMIKKRQRYKVLRRYLPVIYYYNESYGLVLLPYYKRLRSNEAEIVSIILGNLVEDTRGGDGDLHTSNVAYDTEEERYVILDLGYF